MREARIAWRWLRLAATALGMLMIVITFTPLLGWWTGQLSSKWGPDDGEVLVVLGADMAADDLMGTSTYWRCFYATLVWRQGHFRQLVLSGRGAAPAMRDFLVFRGVPGEAIVVENGSDSTRENAQFVAPPVQGAAGRIIILTSDYHSRRALAAFGKAGIHATALPYPDAFKRINSPGMRWDVFQILATETVKVLVYKLRGWT